MFRSPAPRGPVPGAGLDLLVAAMLSGALLLAGVLAWQAVDAARSHRAAAERVLRDYAAFAAAELGRRADGTLGTARITAEHFPTTAADGLPAGAPLPGAAEWAAAARSQDSWCECLGGMDGFFVLDLRTGAAEWSGTPPAAARAWALAEARSPEAVSTGGAPAEVSLFGEVEGRRTTNRYQMRIRRNHTAAATVGGVPRALVFTVVADDAGRPRAAYGMTGGLASMVAPVVERVVARHPLLPPSLAGGRPNLSLLAVRVDAPDGTPLVRAGSGLDARFAAADTFRGAFEGIVASVALHPGAAERLLIGGLPRSRVPAALGLFALAAGLVGAAAVQLRRRSALVRMRADFVSGVSHELRTPLAQIRMFAELVAGGRLRGEAERQRCARVIDREARRLSYLVENVLDFSRAERGSPAGARARVRLDAVVRETLDEFSAVAEGRARLEARVAAEVEAETEPGALRQVLLNLLDNALKYGPAGQTVTVGLERAGDVARLWVEDEGPGIPPAERERVWRPYHRLSREVERVAGGSGIGLAVVHAAVERNGGTCRVEDAAGGSGARLVVELPALPAAAPAVEVAV